MADYVNIPFRLTFFEEEKLPIITASIFRAEVSEATIDSIPRIVCVRKGNEVSAFNEHSLKGPSSRHTQMHFNDLAAGEMYRIGLSTFVSQFPWISPSYSTLMESDADWIWFVPALIYGKNASKRIDLGRLFALYIS